MRTQRAFAVLFAAAFVVGIGTPAAAEPTRGHVARLLPRTARTAPEVRDRRSMIDIEATGPLRRDLVPAASELIETSYAARVAIEGSGVASETPVRLFDPDTLLLLDRLAPEGPLLAAPASPLGLLRGIELPAHHGHAVVIRPSLDLTKIGMLAAGSF